MRLAALAICSLAILAVPGCDSGNQNHGTQPESKAADGKPKTAEEYLAHVAAESARSSAGDKSPQTVGRFQILVTGQRVLKLDTATGQTWALLEDSRWKFLSTLPSKAWEDEAGLAELWERGPDGKPHPTGKWIVPAPGTPVEVWERGPGVQLQKK
jgi:hypothetical protein